MNHHQCRLDIAEFPVSTLVKIVANLLESVIRANDALSTAQSNVTLFHSRSVPAIKISAYLARILKFTPFHNEVLLSLLVYFDRIAKLRRGRFALCSLNIHRLLITSIVVASKFTSDVFYPNTRYAKVGGLPLLELNKLEIEFLFLCNFDLRVRLEALQEYGDQLLAHALSQQSLLVELTQLDLVQMPPKPNLPTSSRKRPRSIADADATAVVDDNNREHLRFPLTPPYNSVQHHHHHTNILDSTQIIKRRRNSTISIATTTNHHHLQE